MLQTQHRDNLDDAFVQRILDIVGEFTGLGGISASIASSESMRSFFLSIMNCTLSYREAYTHVHFDPNTQVPPLNRAKITESILRVGRKAYNTLEQEMTRYLYVNVMIDAATVLTMRVVHTTLTNPFSDTPPIPFHATKKEDQEWCTEDYVTEISCIFAELKSRGKMIPVSICHDRLSAQATAVIQTLHQMKESQDPSDKLIIDIPCVNNILSNAFTSIIVGPFKHMIQEGMAYANHLRDRAAVVVIGTKCPLPPATRWLYITDTLAFIIRQRRRIREFLAHEYAQLHPDKDIDTTSEMEKYEKYVSIPPLFFELYGVLMPFKLASLRFESSSSRLSDILPIVSQLQKAFARMIDDKLIEIELVYKFLHEMLSQWFARLETYLPEETWACWALTRSGRYTLRKRVNHSVLLCGPACDYARPKMRKNEAARFVKDKCKKIMIVLRGKKEREEPREDAVSDSDDSSEDSDSVQFPENPLEEASFDEVEDRFAEAVGEEHTLRSQFNIHLDENRAKELHDLFRLDVYYQAYEKSLKVIMRYCITLDEEQTETKVMELFDNWLYHGKLPRLELDRDSEYDMWTNMMKYDDVRPLARAAVRLISAASSESSVERHTHYVCLRCAGLAGWCAALGVL